MTTRAVTDNRHALRRAVKTEQKRIRARALSDIRAEIAGAHERRRHALTLVRAQCGKARDRVRARVKAHREAARAAVNLEVERMREDARAKCRARRSLVTESSKSAATKKRAELVEARREAAMLRRIESKEKAAHRRREKSERRRESDDEVRGNLDPGLVPVFNAVRSRIGAREGMSRTEAFTHWVEEHEGEVWALREKQAAAELRALLAEEKRRHAALRRCGGKCSKATAAELAAVPF